MVFNGNTINCNEHKKNKAVFIKEEFDVKKYEIDMCSGSVFQKMLIFAVPLMFSSILQLLFNAADIVVVGRFAGDNALAGSWL